MLCAKTHKRKQEDLKTHKTRTDHASEIDKVTMTVIRVSKLQKKTEMKDTMPKVRWGELQTVNSWRFKYLRSI